jgi:predicted RNA binding protein YcfA (HicA-like mRNA interferase family)
VEGKHFNHPRLIIENRSRMKIMLFDADKELPIKTIRLILKQAINLYKTGVVQLKAK